MLKNGVLVGFGPSDPKENLILSLEHVKSNFKSDSALYYIAGQFLKNSTVVTIISFCNFFIHFVGRSSKNVFSTPFFSYDA